jgi:hypothetical protein
MLIWDASLLYIYDEKPLISGISDKTYAETLQTIVVLCDFFVWGQKISATLGGLRIGGIRGYN